MKNKPNKPPFTILETLPDGTCQQRPNQYPTGEAACTAAQAVANATELPCVVVDGNNEFFAIVLIAEVVKNGTSAK